MAIDPRLCCAAEICCPPPIARQTKINIIKDLMGNKWEGTSEEIAVRFADNMTRLGLEFAPAELMKVIAEIANHPNRSSMETKT